MENSYTDEEGTDRLSKSVQVIKLVWKDIPEHAIDDAAFSKALKRALNNYIERLTSGDEQDRMKLAVQLRREDTGMVNHFHMGASPS